jgi:hypothetical protein
MVADRILECNRTADNDLECPTTTIAQQFSTGPDQLSRQSGMVVGFVSKPDRLGGAILRLPVQHNSLSG